MARRPSFQFYPADWRSDAKLRRCSRAARGDWMDILGVLHDSEEYGVVRYPLRELAQAAGVPLSGIKELVAKGVLKGSDSGLSEPFTYTPRSGRQDGNTVTLIDASDGPIWFSSRMVRDEYVRTNRGASTRFGVSPTRRVGEDQSDGSSSSSSTSLDDDDRRARVEHLIEHTCNQLKLAPVQNTDYFTWFRAFDALIEDGFTDKEIKSGVEVARQKGSRNMNFIISCVRSPPRAPPEIKVIGGGRLDTRTDEERRKAVLGE